MLTKGKMHTHAAITEATPMGLGGGLAFMKCFQTGGQGEFANTVWARGVGPTCLESMGGGLILLGTSFGCRG